MRLSKASRFRLEPTRDGRSAILATISAVFAVLDEGEHDMPMDVVDYEIFGSDMQYVEIELDPGEATVGEAGAMMRSLS